MTSCDAGFPDPRPEKKYVKASMNKTAVNTETLVRNNIVTELFDGRDEIFRGGKRGIENLRLERNSIVLTA